MEKKKQYLIDRENENNKDSKNNKDDFKVGLVNNLSDEDFFDDCPICRMMKKAKEESREPTPDEMKKAYKEAGEQGGLIGGDLFKK